MATPINCREEAVRRFPIANGRLVTVTLRNSLVPEDPYLVLAKAKAFSVRTGERYTAPKTPRSVKDILIKTNISI
jgi:hypothetical protein